MTLAVNSFQPGFHQRQRRAFSLLEILLALAILGGSLAILSQIADTGTTAALESQALAEARMVAQTKLNELLLEVDSGTTPVNEFDVPIGGFHSSSITPMTYSAEIGDAPLDGLLSLRITVKTQSGDSQTQLAELSLTRWVVDPALELEQAELDERAAREGLAGESETTDEDST